MKLTNSSFVLITYFLWYLIFIFLIMFQIEATNNFYGHDFAPKNKGSPKVWIENWTGW